MRRGRVLIGLAVVALVAGGWWVRLALGTRSPILRTIPLDGIPAALAVDERTQRVFVISSYDGGSRMLDARTGAAVRTLPVVGGAVAVDEKTGRVFVAGSGGVSVLDAASGRLLHTTSLAVAPDALAVDTASGHVFVVTPGSDTVTMLDASSGAILHTASTVMMPQAVLGDPRAGLVYVASGTPLVAVLDARSGSVLRTTALRGLPNPAAMDVATGRIAVADPGSATVSLLDPGGTAAARTITIPAAPIAVTAAHTGQVYVLTRVMAHRILPGGPAPVLLAQAGGSIDSTASGSVYVLDGRSGARLHSLPAGLAPLALALDGPSGHLFVANGFGVRIAPDPWAWLPSWLRRRLQFLPPPGPRITVVRPHLTMLAVPR